jgi:hypothetical protein
MAGRCFLQTTLLVLLLGTFPSPHLGLITSFRHSHAWRERVCSVQPVKACSCSRCANSVPRDHWYAALLAGTKHRSAHRHIQGTGHTISQSAVILYFSILLHCIIQWALEVISPSACSCTVCRFPLPFTTCFGLHGHVQVCRIFIFICFKDSASLQTSRQGNNKNNEGKQHMNKTQMENKRSRILQTYENKISYAPEDGHVGRNM